MKVIVECDTCGQENRAPWPIPAGKRVQCGQCHAPFDADAIEAAADEDEDDFEDEDEDED